MLVLLKFQRVTGPSKETIFILASVGESSDMQVEHINEFNHCVGCFHCTCRQYFTISDLH